MNQHAVPDGHRLKICADCSRQYLVLRGDEATRCASCRIEGGEVEPDIYNNKRRRSGGVQ